MEIVIKPFEGSHFGEQGETIMMNDPHLKLCDELRAELGSLHEKVRILEAKQAESKVRAVAIAGRRFGKNILISLISLLGLLSAGGLLYGQDAIDALFIDKDGNATFSRKIQLDGNQQIKFTDSDTSNNLKLQLWSGYGLGINGGTLFYAANGRHSWRDDNGTNERMALTTGADGGLTVTGTGNSSFAGNVGIGATGPGAKLDVAGTVRLGKGVAESWFPYTDNNAYISGNQTIIRSDSSGNHKEFVRISQNGNVGIGTTDPKAKLDVVGGVKATSVNGEKPPLVFDVGQINDTTNWHHVEQDIGPLCGDADGCTMKFFLRHSLNDEVRTISEQIYIEQPDKSNNKEPGLRGWTRQLGGGDTSFILQTAAKYEIVGHPWDWIWVHNYSHPNVGPASNAFSGYNVQFLTHPHITATVAIYDR